MVDDVVATVVVIYADGTVVPATNVIAVVGTMVLLLPLLAPLLGFVFFFSCRRRKRCFASYCDQSHFHIFLLPMKRQPVVDSRS